MADAYSSSISFAMPRSSSIWFFKKLANISTSFSFNRRALFRIKMTLHFVYCTVSHFVIIDYLTIVVPFTSLFKGFSKLDEHPLTSRKQGPRALHFGDFRE